MIKITIPGEPVPKQRPRMIRQSIAYNPDEPIPMQSRATKQGIVYTPAKTRRYEQLVQEIYNSEIKHDEFYDKGIPLVFRVKAFFAIPKSWSKRKQQQALDGELDVTKRPDGDNILKICMDALNGVAFYDDAQIIEMSISKHYSDNPRVEIEIERK